MEYIPRSNAEVFKADTITAWEYETESKVMNVAHIQVNGRYPTEGFTMNRDVDSIIHVIGGEGILGMLDGTSIQLTDHDQIHLATGDVYFIQGELDILYSASPKWTPEQTQHISD